MAAREGVTATLESGTSNTARDKAAVGHVGQGQDTKVVAAAAAAKYAGGGTNSPSEAGEVGLLGLVAYASEDETDSTKEGDRGGTDKVASGKGTASVGQQEVLSSRAIQKGGVKQGVEAGLGAAGATDGGEAGQAEESEGDSSTDDESDGGQRFQGGFF
jgi:hypothetical protein